MEYPDPSDLKPEPKNLETSSFNLGGDLLTSEKKREGQNWGQLLTPNKDIFPNPDRIDTSDKRQSQISQRDKLQKSIIEHRYENSIEDLKVSNSDA